MSDTARHALPNAVRVDVNWRLAPPAVEYIVNDAEAKVLVVGPDCASFPADDLGATSAADDNFSSLLPLAKEMWELSPDAVDLIAMPLFHIGGGGWAVVGMYEG